MDGRINFFTEYGSYADCLDTMGYNPSREIENRYYAIGFKTHTSGTNKIAVAGGAPKVCAETQFACNKSKKSRCYSYAAGKGPASLGPMPVIFYFSATANPKLYAAFASGHISPDSPDKFGDSWYIDQAKRIRHLRKGY